MSFDYSNPQSVFNLKGKSALITGASGAFGKVAAQALAGAGCNLLLAAANNDALINTKKHCIELGANVESENVRPDNEEICNGLVAKAVEKFGSIDILIIASGLNIVSKIDEMSLEDFLQVIDGNVTQSWICAKAVAKQMKIQKSGKIIFMSSARGLLGHPAGYTAYCASKSAVDGMTKALGCELGNEGITVNAIAPTVFRSPLTSWMFEDNENANMVRKNFLTRIPKNRLGEPDDLVGPLLFLCSAASDFYTGHILYADGGYTAG